MNRCAAVPRPRSLACPKEQHPGPHVDVDAELEAAHPPREQHLRAEGEDRADDPDQEDRAGETLRDEMLGIEEACLEPIPGTGQRRAFRRSICRFGAGEGQIRLRGFAPPGLDGAWLEGGTPSKEPLRFGWVEQECTAGARTGTTTDHQEKWKASGGHHHLDAGL